MKVEEGDEKDAKGEEVGEQAGEGRETEAGCGCFGKGSPKEHGSVMARGTQRTWKC